jgi:hypothetical protein
VSTCNRWNLRPVVRRLEPIRQRKPDASAKLAAGASP